MARFLVGTTLLAGGLGLAASASDAVNVDNFLFAESDT